MNTHTKGPWKRWSSGEVMVVRAPDGSRLAHVTYLTRTGRRDPEEVEANGSLTAAAPQLLEALEVLMDALPEDKEWGHFIDIKDAARAAIAKARGEKQ